MLYATLCYHAEAGVVACSRQGGEAAAARRGTVTKSLAGQGKLGPVVRLMPTTAAVTIRSGREPLIIDGPFAETQEQLLGLYIVDCDSLDEAIDTARRIKADERGGAFEVRPLRLFEANTTEFEPGV